MAFFGPGDLHYLANATGLIGDFCLSCVSPRASCLDKLMLCDKVFLIKEMADFYLPKESVGVVCPHLC